MADLEEQARPAVAALLDESETTLLVELGNRLQAIERDPAVGQAFTSELELELLGPLDDLRDFGRSFFERINVDAYQLICVAGARREEIKNLRPQEHKLIRYMDQRNRANKNALVLCSYDELISAIWGDESGHVEAEVNRLVWELRQKIEPDVDAPCFLQNVKGLGYRLVTQPIKGER
jgi:hypothetical protein